MYELPYLLRRAHYAFRQAMDTELEQYGLTWAQFDVLLRVIACDCAEHRELLKEMDVASPTLTKLVNSLVDSGYLERRTSPEDARVKLLTMTEAGLDVHQRVITHSSGLFNTVLTGFSTAERMMFVEMLQRFIDNLDGIGT